MVLWEVGAHLVIGGVSAGAVVGTHHFCYIFLYEVLPPLAQKLQSCHGLKHPKL